MSVSVSASASLIRSLPRQKDRDQSPEAQTVTILAGGAHDDNEWWIGRILHSLVARRTSREMSGQRRW